jgi:hypothetical protein
MLFLVFWLVHASLSQEIIFTADHDIEVACVSRTSVQHSNVELMNVFGCGIEQKLLVVFG